MWLRDHRIRFKSKFHNYSFYLFSSQVSFFSKIHCVFYFNYSQHFLLLRKIDQEDIEEKAMLHQWCARWTPLFCQRLWSINNAISYLKVCKSFETTNSDLVRTQLFALLQKAQEWHKRLPPTMSKVYVVNRVLGVWKATWYLSALSSPASGLS